MAKEIGLASTGHTRFLGYPSTNREWNISYSDGNLDDSFGRRYGHDELGRVKERYTAYIRNYRSFGYDAAGPLEGGQFPAEESPHGFDLLSYGSDRN